MRLGPRFGVRCALTFELHGINTEPESKVDWWTKCGPATCSPPISVKTGAFGRKLCSAKVLKQDPLDSDGTKNPQI